MEIRIIEEPIKREELIEFVKRQYGEMTKAVVDVGTGRVALGGELHMDAAAKLEDGGSAWSNLWGINLYPEGDKEFRLEFDSMVNIKPAQGNRSRNVEDSAVREKIEIIVRKLIP